MDTSVIHMVQLLVKLSVLATVFCLGLNARLTDIGFLLRQPGKLLRALLAMYVLTPLLAVLLVLFVPAPLEVKIAVLLMAISAGAPLLPRKLLKFGGNPHYIYSLSFLTALFAMIAVPVSLHLLGIFFGRDVSVAPVQVATTLIMVLLAPLLAGMLVRQLAPALADRIAEPLMTLAGIVLLGLVLLIVFADRHAIVTIGLSGMLLIVLTTAASLAVGHGLGGSDDRDRGTLAIACATRFPGLVILIASLNFPKAKPLPIVVAYLLVSGVVVLLYIRWRRGALRSMAH